VTNQQDVAGATVALNDERAQRSVLCRARIVKRLGKLGHSVAVEPLSVILETDPDDDVRGLAAIALGRIKDPAAAPVLRKALDEPTVEGQKSAILSLWLLRDRSSAPRLRERLLHSTSSDIRQFAANALGDIGDQDAVLALIEALDDPKAYVRSAAAASLGELGDTRALEPLRLAHQSAKGFSRRRMGRVLKRLEGRLRPTWRSRVRKRLLDTDRLIAIEMRLMASVYLASSISKALKIRGKGQRQLAAAVQQGRRLFSAGREQETFDFLERAVKQFPDDAEIRWLYAAILLAFRPDDVAQQAAKAVELAPNDPSILVRAGGLLLNRGQVEEARVCVARANELAEPDFVLMPGLENLNGLLADHEGKDDLAEEKLRSAVKREPDNGPFAIDLARYLASRERRSEAVDVIDQALMRTGRREDLERVRAEITDRASRE
jgi:HEAT repeat protein/Tfp pilus assembly protein PilF